MKSFSQAKNFHLPFENKIEVDCSRGNCCHNGIYGCTIRHSVRSSFPKTFCWSFGTIFGENY